MKISGFTFIRNAVKNDYPIVEAILSILPICDEFVIAHGNSDDETLMLLKSIESEKIRIIQTVWDDSIREGGRTFAQETDKALKAISPDADWAFYIQGDEAIHEKYLPVIKKAMQENLHNDSVEGLLFKYLHFYGSYNHVARSRRWYRHEIRVFKPLPGMHSYRDAQGFRLDNRKIQVREIDAWVYHYGWVKPPQGINTKVRNFSQFYHNEEWMSENMPENFEFDYHNIYHLEPFAETHPQVMQARVDRMNWSFSLSKARKKKPSLRYRILDKIEELTGLRIGEYKNYKKLTL